MTLIAFGIIAGILFILSVIFPTALIRLRLQFVAEGQELNYLVNQLVRATFRRYQIGRFEQEPTRNPSLSYRRIKRRQTKIVALLQDQDCWDEEASAEVARRVKELVEIDEGKSLGDRPVPNAQLSELLRALPGSSTDCKLQGTLPIAQSSRYK